MVRDMAPYTRSQVTPAMRESQNNIFRSVDEYNRKIYEEQRREALEKKEQKKIEKAAESLMMLSKVYAAPVNHRPITRNYIQTMDNMDMFMDAQKDKVFF